MICMRVRSRRLVAICAFVGIWLVMPSTTPGVHHVQAATFFPLNLFKFKAPALGIEQQQAAAQHAASGADAIEQFGYIEYRPNGTLILRSTMENGTNLQNLLLFKSVLNAIKVAKFITRNQQLDDGNGNGNVNATSTSSTSTSTTLDDHVKMYGDGVEHKFPPFLERILQRIQTYFSIYKYTDTSQALPQIQSAPVAVNAVNVSANALLDFDPDVGEPAPNYGHSDGVGVLQSTTNIVQFGAVTAATQSTAKYTEFIALESEHGDNATTKAATTTMMTTTTTTATTTLTKD